MAKIYLIIQVVLLFPFFLSCTYGKSCIDNLNGIYATEKREYSNAIALFAKTDEKKYATYNMASVYGEIGELDAAEKKLTEIDYGEDKELEVKILSQIGTIAFQQKNYEKAVVFFKNSIIINNSDKQLIQNLEIALLMMEDERTNRENESRMKTSVTHSDKNSSSILNLMFSGAAPVFPEKKEEKDQKEKDW